MFFVWTLALLGLLLIFLEFFLPGAVMAIGGALLLLASLFFFHMEKPGFPSFIGYLSLLTTFVYFIVKLALWRVKLSAKQGTLRMEGDQEGFVACVYSKEWIGKIGLAHTDLKPSGYITIEGKRFQAVSKTGYIDKDTPIEILEGSGSHLIVGSLSKEI